MRRIILIGVVLALAFPPVLPAAAQESPAPASGDGTDARVGGTVVVGVNETAEGDLTAMGGTVVVRGTIEGDLEAHAATVVITEGGRVEGKLRAYAGSVRIAGTVGRSALSYAGSVTLAEGGEVRGTFGAFAGDVNLRGTVNGDANVAATTVTLGETARIRGDLNYDGSLADEGGHVDGATRASDDLALAPSIPYLGPLVSVYLLLADLLLGTLLLYAFPRFSQRAADTAASEPLRTGGVGLAALIAGALALIALVITVVGIPLAFAGLALFLLGAWVATVYGRFAVGSWLLAYANVNNRWVALALGVMLVAVLARLPIPYLGPLIRLGVLLLGAGVLTLGLLAVYRAVREGPTGLTGFD